MTNVLRIHEMNTPRNGWTNLQDALDSLLDGNRYVCVDGTCKAGAEHGIRKLEMSADGHSGRYVCIDSIRMEETGGGKGTSLMRILCGWADKNEVTLTLTPSDSFGASSVKRLVSFYKRFGFVENRGPKSDYATRQSMYRPPVQNEKGEP